MQREISPNLVAEAITVGYAFWMALAADDDDALRVLLSPFALEWAMAQNDGHDLAKAIREWKDITPEVAGELGRVDPIDVLANRRFRVAYTWYPGQIPMEIDDTTLGWRLEVQDTGTRWTVDPIKKHADMAIGTIRTRPVAPRLTVFNF